MAVFAAIDALTWGFALAAIVPTENGLEFSMIAVASSFAVLILAGCCWLNYVSPERSSDLPRLEP